VNARQTVQISNEQVEQYLQRTIDRYSRADSSEWSARLYRLLNSNRDAGLTAALLGQEDGLSVVVEQDLMSLWFDYVRNETDYARRPTVEQREASQKRFWEQGLAIVKASKHHPVAIRIALSVGHRYGQCDFDQFDALLANTPNPLETGLVAAQQVECLSWWLSLHARFPADGTILLRLSHEDRELQLASRLAIQDELAAVTPASEQSRVEQIREHTMLLWMAGLIFDGLTFLERQPAADRQAFLSGQDKSDELADFSLAYTAVLSLSGRLDDAKREFERLPLTAELRPLRDCFLSKSPIRDDSGPCAPAAGRFAWRWNALDHLFNRPAEDPYLISENSFPEYGSALWADVYRELFSGDNYQGLRRSIAEQWLRSEMQPPNPALAPMLTRFMGEEFNLAAHSYESRIRTAASAWNVALDSGLSVRRTREATPPPLPKGFRELPMPDVRKTAANSGDKPMRWPSDMAGLPTGFSPVRVERGNPYTIAVSLSQTLDPAGEVSSGGYWIHLSRTGGQTWQTPLYTGLMQHFPYVVAPVSGMRLWSGDRITLEVAVQELDPASITYPPVALRSRRQVRDLYLEIPLEALQSDRDGDGLTDIVEEHLLLDPDNPDSDGDGIRDGDDPLPNVKNEPAATANSYLARILEHIFKRPEQAIIEPVDRGPGVLIAGQLAVAPSLLRPLFVVGNPADFAGLRTALTVLVYSPEDVERLLARSADFHALDLSGIVFNRAHDRGHLTWNLGWTGGALRVIRQGNVWRVESMGQWVS